MRLDLADATTTDVEDADVAAALLPVGSTEQHGPHAPLGTDTLTARAIAERGADAYDADGRRIAVAPAIPVGIAAEHRAFAGTLHVSPDVFRAYVRETIESLLVAVDAPVVIVNGHGGNAAALDEVAARVSRSADHRAVDFTWFKALDRYPDQMGHGGPIETAVLRYLHPALIRDDRTAEAGERAADRWGTWVGGTNLAHDTDQFVENGVVGDPDALDADEGRRLVDEAIAALADVLVAIAE